MLNTSIILAVISVAPHPSSAIVDPPARAAATTQPQASITLTAAKRTRAGAIRSTAVQSGGACGVWRCTWPTSGGGCLVWEKTKCKVINPFD